MLAGILKVVIYAFLSYFVYVLFRFFRALGKGSNPPRTSKHASGIMVRDEICNTYLPKEDAVKEVYKGKEYYFCSKECHQKFLNQKKSH